MPARTTSESSSTMWPQHGQVALVASRTYTVEGACRSTCLVDDGAGSLSELVGAGRGSVRSWPLPLGACGFVDIRWLFAKASQRRRNGEHR